MYLKNFNEGVYCEDCYEFIFNVKKCYECIECDATYCFDCAMDHFDELAWPSKNDNEEYICNDCDPLPDIDDE